DLEVDSTSYDPPRYRGGTLRGRAGADVSAAGSVALADIRFDPRNGLRFTRGELTTPDGRTVVLSGDVAITEGGLRGTLHSARADDALLTLGSGPVSYAVSSL